MSRKFPRRGTQRNPLRHIIIKMSKGKDKGRILNVARKKKTKNSYIQRIPHETIIRNFATRKEWHYIFKVLKGQKARIPYLAKLSFRIEGDIKSFPDKQMLKTFITTKLALQEILKGVL